MRNSMKTRLAIFTLLSAAFILGLMLTAPSSRGFAFTSFSCNAVNAGSTYEYYGEEDQKVTFEAFFDEAVPDGFKLNISYNGGASWDDSISASRSGTRVYYNDFPLVNTIGDGSNQTVRFKFSKLGDGPNYTTPEISIKIAEYGAGPDPKYGDPANATNVVLTARAAGAVSITWGGGVRWYDDLGAWAFDNVELYHWEIYRRAKSNGVILTKSDYASATLVAPTLSPTTFQYVDTPPADVEYYYAVVAIDRAGHESMPSAQRSVFPDRTVPSLIEYKMNSTSYKDLGSRMNVPIGGIMKFKFTLSEVSLTGFIVLKTVYNNYAIRLQYPAAYNASGGFYWVDVETTPVGSDPLRLGTYDVTLNFTDGAGNNFLKEYTGQLSIYEPNPIVDALLIIAPIAVGALVVGYIASKKLKQRRVANMQKVDTKGGRRRKGEIYKGASDLGRASGDEAEEILAKRRREAPEPEPKRKAKTKEYESRPTPASAPSSAAEIREKAEKYDTLSATAGTREIRAVEKAQTIDTGKKVGFLEGRVTNLENVMSIAVNLVELIPESPPCEKCGKPLNPSWSKCPWCFTSAQSDELEMKLAISGIDGKKTSACPTCRAPLQPGWVRCPYCATRKV